MKDARYIWIEKTTKLHTTVFAVGINLWKHRLLNVCNCIYIFMTLIYHTDLNNFFCTSFNVMGKGVMRKNCLNAYCNNLPNRTEQRVSFSTWVLLGSKRVDPERTPGGPRTNLESEWIRFQEKTKKRTQGLIYYIYLSITISINILVHQTPYL